MLRKCLLAAAFAMTALFITSDTHAQFGGVQVQVGGYGNGFYGNNGYVNGFQYGYRNYRQPRIFYQNGVNYGGFGYSNYPTVRYFVGTPRYYAAPMRRYYPRRFR